tara:strand:- start:1590 stop:2180 length:591 start_codon:yes stop_codon:yes gene_type:complete
MILSFDIGIKNLAYCILDKHEDNKLSIIKWDIIKLLEDNEKCKGFPLDELTKRLYKQLNSHFYSYNITKVLLENQPVLKNPVMKSVQMIVFSFFQYQAILLAREINTIKLINASNKLKVGKTFTEINNNEDIIKIKSKYTRNKKFAIEYTYKILQDRIENFETLIEYFKENKKRDDLADAFLQGIYYIDFVNPSTN